MSTHRKIAYATLIIIGVGFLSKIAGLALDILIANNYGASAQTDAFIMATTIPEIIMNLFAGGVLVAAFLPVFSHLLTQRREEEAWRLAGGMMNLLLLVLGILAAAGMVFTPQIVRLFAPGFVKNPETFAITVFLTRITFPTIIFFGLANLFQGVLNSFEKFALPALTSFALNAFTILGGLTLGSFFQHPITGLTVGFLLGAVVQAAMQLPAILKRGNIFHLGLNLDQPEFKKVGALLLPLVVGEMFGRLYMVVDRVVASFLLPGSIAALTFAGKLTKLPIRMIGGSASAAMFPTLSKQVAAGAEREFYQTLEKAFRLVLFLTMPMLLYFALFRTTIISVLFKRGAFDEQAVLLTSFALLLLSFEVVAGSVGDILNRAFYARQDTFTPLVANVISMLVKIALSVSLVWWWYQKSPAYALAGLALATTVSSWLKSGILGGYLIYKEKNMSVAYILPALAKTLLLSLVALGGVDLLLIYYLPVVSKTDLYINFGLSLMGGGGLYLLGAYLFQFEEFGMLWNLLKKRKASK